MSMRSERLRTMADPVRLVLYRRIGLARRGTVLSTADLARLVPTARRGIQAHLEALRKAGWIETVGGQGRSATWRRVIEPPAQVTVPGQAGGSVTWSEADEWDRDPEAALAAMELDRVVNLGRFDLVQQWTRERQAGDWSNDWIDASISRDFFLLVSPEQLHEIDAAIKEVLNRYPRAGDQAPDEVSPESRAVSVAVFGFPVALDE